MSRSTIATPFPAASDYWMTRHHTCDDGPETWIRKYWASWRARHREVILSAINRLMPDRTRPFSLLEVGSHVGANFRKIAAERPGAVFTGIDINPFVVEQGQTLLNAARIPATLQVGTFGTDGIPVHDIALTCYTLAYVRPDALPTAMSWLLAHATTAVILAEPSTAFSSAPAGLVGPDLEEWRHDYIALVRDIARPRLAGFFGWDVWPPVDRLDAVHLVVLHPMEQG